MTQKRTIYLFMMLVAIPFFALAGGKSGLGQESEAARNRPSTKPREALISITLDDVDIVDLVRMFTRISGANIQMDPQALQSAGRITMNVRDQPWKVVLSQALVSRGLALVPHPSQQGSYSILKIDTPGVAARHLAATEAVELAKAVLSSLGDQDVASAIKRLQQYLTVNTETIQSITKQE